MKRSGGVMSVHGGCVRMRGRSDTRRSVPSVSPPEGVEGTGGLPDLSGKTVLIAEDSAGDRAMLRAMLEPTGADILTAASGVEALSACLRGGPDLLLLDIDLPVLHGAEVTRKLRRCGRTLPIVALTGHAGLKDVSAGFAAGVDAYLTKPFRIDSLYGLLSRYLEAPGQR